MSPRDTPLVWLRSAVRTPPMSREARLEAGYRLRLLRRGQSFAMPESRPMTSVGPGATNGVSTIATSRGVWNTTVRQAKRKKLESSGWTVGSAQQFLGLTDGEAQYVELRRRLAEGLKKDRSRRDITQTQLAKTVGSSQSRVAKMEAGDATVSVDLLVRSLLRLGASTRDIERMLSSTT